eukprot:TRINITY_DN76008_c0_g1_i1.p1 TRINITY_DN76008_c0_g1~~TRINITY_DN76008_c0_g1_i1.p1  ORF type:complete len:200 (+),score=50.78 TRINITY_DN76008_c0_g1_i1:89-688(+)
MLADELAQSSLLAGPVQELVKLLRSKRADAIQHGHAWLLFDLEKDGCLHPKEAVQLKDSFRAALEQQGLAFSTEDHNATVAFWVQLDLPRGPTWPGPVQELLTSMQIKCKQHAENGHSSCRFDLVDDGHLHEVEALKLKDSFERAARSKGVSVQSWSSLYKANPCYEIRWAVNAKQVRKREAVKESMLERPNKSCRGGA